MAESEKDEASDKEETWRDQPFFVPIANLLRRQMPLELQDLLDQQPCFGWCWRDDEGLCPVREECDLKSFCERAYNMATVEKAHQAQKPPVDVPPLPPSDVPYSVPQPIRNKWAGTKMYLRSGYADYGRPVDEFLAAFKAVIGEISEMPLVWHKKNFEQKYGGETFKLCATTSYHSIMKDGVVMVRFWTNAAKHALVDVAPELVPPLFRISKQLGSANPHERSQMERPFTIPANSWKKLQPCTHRVRIRSAAAAQELAKVVRMRLEMKRKKR